MTGIQEALPSRLDDLTRVGDENSSGPIANKTPMSGSVFKNLALALVSGGDSRLRIDRGSGLNKYLCPAEPGAGIVCASSCTASPIAQSGFDRAGALFEAFCGAASVRARRLLLQEEALRIEKCLLRYFKADPLAEAILCPSGTDALLTAARLLAAERPGTPMTAILPLASETGTGVPLAAAGRVFDGPRQGRATTRTDVGIMEVALRAPDGAPLPEDEIDAAYAASVSHARGRAVVYLTYGTKTGLIAPHTPPADADVIVDACQARIDPARVTEYLRCGWPVVVTGSKFFGGPAFSGAILFPLGRQARSRPACSSPGAPGLGTVLRWTAALEAIERFSSVAHRAASFLRQRATAIRDEIAANPALAPVGGFEGHGPHWADQPSIVTFAMRDPVVRGRLLSANELRPTYERLARDGILLGQPVGLGAFGGLRIAIGARDVIQRLPDGVDRLVDAIKVLGREPAPLSSGFGMAAE